MPTIATIQLESSSTIEGDNVNPDGLTSYYYRCVGCLHPCASLYKTLGKGGSVIKLTPCTKCARPSADPYCEREWLLVVLDLILLRKEAYRHVLWNRGQLLAAMTMMMSSTSSTAPSSSSPQQPEKFNTASTTTTMFRKFFHGPDNTLHHQIPRFLWTASLLRAHIGMVSTQDRVDHQHTWKAATGFVQLAVVSVIGLVLQIGVLFLLLGHLGGADAPPVKNNNNNNMSHKTRLLCVLALAVLLPSVGNQTVTALSLLWENSHTVRVLGSILTLVHQCLSVGTVLQVQLYRKSTIRSISVASGAVLFLLLSLFLRALAMTKIQATVPCPGLGWERENGRILCFS